MTNSVAIVTGASQGIWVRFPSPAPFFVVWRVPALS